MSPLEIDYLLRTAFGHFQSGQRMQAEMTFRQIVDQHPDHDVALHGLGILALQNGQAGLAVEYLRRAAALRPNIAAYQGNLGNALRTAGMLDEAIDCYRRALEIEPNFAEAHIILGNALEDQGNVDEAIGCYRRALQRNPDSFQAHHCLGSALHGHGKPDEAIASYRRALALKPDDAKTLSNLGVSLFDLGKLDEAEICARRALNLMPGIAEAHNNLGVVLNGQGKLDEAIASYLRALELKPSYAEAHSNLGVSLYDQGRLGEAAACQRRALTLNPAYAEAYNNLGNALHRQERLNEAVSCFRRALELKPGYAEAHYNLGVALNDAGKLDEAAACHRRALELKPGHAAALCNLVYVLQHLCEWDELEGLSKRVAESIDANVPGGNDIAAPPFLLLALPTYATASRQLRCAQRWADVQIKKSAAAGSTRGFDRPVKRGSKIVIGYLSADFRTHAVAVLVAELFEKHDRDRFEIVGYSYGRNDGSPIRRRLVESFDRFVDIEEASFAQAAQRIAADGVDILIDLQGYTKNARTAILVDRPAPIQVNYLGYPGTMGASFVDYILVDDFIVPPDRQPYYAEKLVHLPGCYQVNDSRRPIAPETPSKAECGLPAEGFVFCSFNNNYKITAEVFSVWMRLLGAVPGSVLWLLEDNRFVAANLRREAHSRGIAPERLVFAPRRPGPEHLARHRLADLFLDTLPYNAHVTASDSLWAGCPLLTNAGDAFPSRVAGSLLRAVGLADLITTSLADYETLALRLARDRRLLGELRSRLTANRETAAVFQAEPFARNIEKAFTTMWDIYASGEKPRSFVVT